MRKVTSWFVTVFEYGSGPSICSWHKTFYNAERAAIKCENRGGAHHEIWEVKIYPRVERRGA